MIFWPCCCDKDCSCIGCATLKIEGASSHPDYGTSDVYTELAYNRTVVMWDKDNSTDTPFDLLGTPGDCGDDYTNYTGTKCKGESFACCPAHYYDDTIEPVPMVVGGVTQTPPTPVAGSDCFPALSCFYDVSQTTTWLTKPEQPTHHYYVDTSGYVWLAIVSYEFVVALQSLRPHWIFIYKSSEVINCQTINSSNSVGTSFTMTAVCDGLAAGVDDCSAIAVPLLDMSAATITLTIYPNVTYCCDLSDDKCNDDEGACSADVPCYGCLGGTASNRYLLELEIGWELGCCPKIAGSYVLEYTPPDEQVWEHPVLRRGCLWYGCFDIDPCYDEFWELWLTKVEIILEIGSAIFLKIFMSDRCFGTPGGVHLLEFLGGQYNPDLNCLEWNRYRVSTGMYEISSTCGPDLSGRGFYLTAI